MQTEPVQQIEGYSNIVITTDGSDGADHAASHGLLLAERFGANVHVVAVAEDPGIINRDQLRTSPDELATEAATDVADNAQGRGIPVETATPSGLPSEEILRYLSEHDVDAAVMSTHGRTGLEQVAFGSVIEEVVRESPVPVLTVRPPQWDS